MQPRIIYRGRPPSYDGLLEFLFRTFCIRPLWVPPSGTQNVFMEPQNLQSDGEVALSIEII